jgi:hypothetical protein
MKTLYTIAWIVFSIIAVILMITGEDYSQITMNLVLALMFYQYAKDEE